MARATRFGVESLERRLLLAAAGGAETSADAPVPAPLVSVASESITGPLNINQLVASGRAIVTATQGDIGSVSNIFDGDNASLYRTANIDPIVVEISFTTPKTVREFTLRFSHAGGSPAYRWRVEGQGGSLPGAPAWTQIAPTPPQPGTTSYIGTPSDIDSKFVLAAPVTVQRLRLTGERLTGDNYVHLDEWRIVGDLVINSLALVPPNTSHSLAQFQTRQLRAEGVADDGSRVDLTDRVVWTSSNEAVATVDATGLVRAVGVGSSTVRAAFGSLQINTTVNVTNPRQRDLDVTYIARTPRYNYDAAKKNPAPGDLVTFEGHVRNWDNLTPSAEYRWELDGVPVASGTLTDLGANEERVVTWQWNWQNGPHRVRLTVDPANAVAELSEVNNVVEDRTDGLIVAFWVEQSLYDYFHERQRNLGIGSNSWEDWAQRQMAKWNEHNATAIWDVTPNGVTDRVRIDKITVVPDGALPLNGGLPSNNPDSRDRTPDLVWGFEWDPNSTFYSNTTSRDPNNPFYLEPSLVHEMGHARYLVDNYTWDVANNTDVTQVQITEPTTGQPVAGTSLMPYLAFNSVLYYNQSGGVMTGPYGNNVWSPHEAGALQRIAGRRAVSGNMNAPGNFGEFLNDLPAANHVRFVNGAGQPLVGADVRWYAASPGPGYGGKTFDNTPEHTLTTDADGYVHLPRDPFLPGQHKEAVMRVALGGQIWYRFFEVAEMNLEYWRGHTANGFYTVELPLRTAAAEMEVQGFNQAIADGDTTPSLNDLTDFGGVNVTPAGPGDGSVIHTFVVKNRGGQPLQLSGSPRVQILGPHAADFSVAYDPSQTLTSQTLTVFQIKFDPRVSGLRTATVRINNNDGNENPYDFAIQGFGDVPGAQTVGAKFNDLDGDGERDAGEPGLAGWTIYGDLDEDGEFDAGEPSTVTSADGSYRLPGLPGDRLSQVREVQQAGWRRTFPAAGFHTFNPFIDSIQIHDFGNTRLARVAGRHVFYNNSAYDGGNPAANAADDGAIAPGKAALLPGGSAGFANVTGYTRGINGVMVDVDLLAGTVDASDFTFLVGDGDPLNWATAPVPSAVTVRPGAGVGGSNRITITWPDGAIRNTWLMTTLAANARTGLMAPDTFTFGNAVGETGDAAGAPAVTTIDLSRTRARTGSTAAIDYVADHNRDGRVDVLDVVAVRGNLSRGLLPPGATSSVQATAAAYVVGVRPFYNNSGFDGYDPAANAADDAALAPGKSARGPAFESNFSNITTYSRGLNGVMIDIAGLSTSAALGADDFVFRTGGVSDRNEWSKAPAPAALTLRRGAGINGSDRVTLVWPDGAIRNTWLQITVLPTADTGLASPVLAYLGNVPGASSEQAVTAQDVLRTRRARSASVGLNHANDFNRDGRVNVLDEKVVRGNIGAGMLSLGLFSTAWGAGQNMPVALAEVAGGVIGNKLYLVGEGNGATLAYDLIAGTWSSATALARRPYQGNHHAAEVINGKLYLFGGLGSSSGGKVQVYDPVANAWTLGAAMPFAAGSSSSAVIGGKAYVAGGIVGSATTDRVARYDPVANSWTELAHMPAGRNHTASGTDGARLWVFGGRGPGSGDSNTVANGFETVQVYDPATNSWRSSANAGSGLLPLPQARGGMGKAVFHDGSFYVMGGETRTGAGATPDGVYSRVDVYRVQTGPWRRELPMLTARHGIFPLAAGNRVYVAGGGIRAGASSSNLLEVMYLPGA